MRKRRSPVEIYNDRWGTVLNVFQVLRDSEKAAELARLLYLTPFARDEFEQVTALPHEALSDVEQARRTILRSFAGFGSASTNGVHATGFRAVSATASKSPGQDWANYPAQIPGFVQRLRGVVIENREALQVIQQHDSPHTLFYLDPPYPHCVRNMRRGNATYAYEMTDDDHRVLATVIHQATAMIVLSGYECDLYRELFGQWTQFQKEHVVDGGRKRRESIWLNPAAVANMPAPALLSLASQ